MATFVFIFEYVSFEQGVDKFHKKGNQTYRLLTRSSTDEIWDDSAPGFAQVAKEAYPDINAYCRIANGSSLGEGVVGYSSSATIKSFREKSFAYVDGNFFDLFSFPVANGVSNALARPNVVAISYSTAVKYFGNNDPMGKVLKLSNQFGNADYVVELIYEDMPGNSNFQYDLLFSLQTLASPANLNGNDGWASLDGLRSQWLKTYVLLEEGADPILLQKKLTDLSSKLIPEESNSIILQSLLSQHLGNSLNDPLPTYGNLTYVYLIGGIALLILAIAWLNYINLLTASSLKRAKEVGIRKLVGAGRYQLIKQFLIESIVLNAISFLVALALVNLLQQTFNYFVGKQLSLEILSGGRYLMIMFGIVSAGALLSGVYVALGLSALKPMQTLKGVLLRSRDGVLLRKVFVVFQFTVSIVLISSTIIMWRQLNYMRNEKLGMELSQLMVVRGPEVGKDSTFLSRTAGFDNELRSSAFVETFTRSGNVPTQGYNFSTAGITKQNPQAGDEQMNYSMITIDEHYFDTYGIELLAGSNFAHNMGSGRWSDIRQVIVNESALNQLGFNNVQEAVGQKIVWGEREYELLGVVKDYHHMSLRQSIDPVIFLPRNDGGYYSIRVSTRNVSENVAALNALYTKYFSGNPFEFYFGDDNYNQLYHDEQQVGNLFTVASTLAIFIGCLGLFGLAAYTVQQREKEIGIHKVLGASATQVTKLISVDFLVLVLIAIALATPIAWISMSQWLSGFANRYEITFWVFVLAGLVAVVIAALTISSQAVKAASLNPVNTLKRD